MNDDARLALYQALLEVTEVDEPGRFLERALGLVVAATSARVGWLGLGTNADGTEAAWSASRGLDGTAPISTAMLGRALAGELLHVASAQEDERFMDRASVRRHCLDTVLCAPLRVAGREVCGVLYLAGRTPPFGEADAALVRTAVHHLSPHAARVASLARWEQPDPTAPYRAELAVQDIAGTSRALATLFRQLRLHAQRDTRLVLLGPRGTGKSTIARAIHDSSHRRDKPFRKVDCTRLSGQGLAADLFGARRGAWTGLDRDLTGEVELAHGGTLFLDEVGALPASEQQMLLTFLDDQVYAPVRDSRRRQGDVRVIVATNEDVEARIADGSYRADFWDRLGHTIRVPSLAERLEDLPLLTDALVRRASARLRVRPRPLSPAASSWLQRQPWPGNVRDLERRLESALLWADDEDAPCVALRHFEADGAPAPPEAPGPDDLREAQHRFRRAHILAVLERHGGHRGRAAKALGLHRTYLQDLLREHGLGDSDGG